MENIADGVNQSFINLTYKNGLSSYTQANCTATVTGQGLLIHRPADFDGSSNHSTWGGFVLDNTNNRFGLIEGHTYIIKVHIVGSTSNRASDIYWTNNVGWGGGGLSPVPTNVDYLTIPANFEGEMDCYYKWTCDTIYKTCTTSYANYFVSGTEYLSYKGFKIGWSYTATGTLGTDIYFSNIRLYDITNGTNPIQITKDGILKCEDLVQLQSGLVVPKFYKSNTAEVSEFIEI